MGVLAHEAEAFAEGDTDGGCDLQRKDLAVGLGGAEARDVVGLVDGPRRAVLRALPTPDAVGVAEIGPAALHEQRHPRRVGVH